MNDDAQFLKIVFEFSCYIFMKGQKEENTR